MKHIKTPLDARTLASVKAGKEVFLSGVIFSMRDKAHKKMLEEWDSPSELKGQIIYYMGPTPTRPGKACGSCGPTTSERMDKYMRKIIEKTGIIGIIGKGARGGKANGFMRGRVVYFITYSGLGALLAKCVKSSRVIRYAELGAEAVVRLEVENMPLMVAQDLSGSNIYGGNL